MPLSEVKHWFLIGFVAGCGFHLAAWLLAQLGGLISNRSAKS